MAALKAATAVLFSQGNFLYFATPGYTDQAKQTGAKQPHCRWNRHDTRRGKAFRGAKPGAGQYVTAFSGASASTTIYASIRIERVLIIEARDVDSEQEAPVSTGYRVGNIVQNAVRPSLVKTQVDGKHQWVLPVWLAGTSFAD